MILGILQARVSSSRLPGKVLKPVLGEPMIIRQIERLQRSKKIDQLVLATSDSSDDFELAAICKKSAVKCFRGSLNDVLDRFYKAAAEFNPRHIVRLTGDCPLADPDLIDKVIEFHLNGNYDYSSNAIEPTFPDGLDVEIFRYKCLETAWREAKLSSDREHVTPFILTNKRMFKTGNFKNPVNLSDYRWTVDEPEDLRLIQAIYHGLYPKNPKFDINDILEFVSSRPELKKINRMHHRNEGYQKSLSKDSAEAGI